MTGGATSYVWPILCLAICVHAPRVAQATRLDADGLKEFVSGDRAAAYPLLGRAMRSGSRDPHVYLFKGSYERETKRLEQALDTFLQGVQRVPEHTALWLELAVTQSWAGDLEGAKRSYLRALQLEHGNRAARVGYARVLAWSGDERAAATIYRDLLRDDPEDVDGLNGMAFLDQADKRFGDAIRRYREVLKHAPHNVEAQEGLARAEAGTRVSVTARLGVASVPSQSADLIGDATIEMAIDGAWRAIGRYEVGGIRVQRDTGPPGVRGASTTHQAGLGVVHQLGERVALSLGYGLAARPDRLDHAGEIGGSAQIAKGWSLIGGARLYISDPLATLVNMGLQVSYRADSYVMIQGFRFDDYHLHHGTTGIASVRHRWSRRWATAAGAGFGFHTQTGYQAIGQAEVTMSMSERTVLLAGYEYFGALFQRHLARVGVRRAF